MPTFYIRDYSGKLTYKLVVRDATEREERSTMNGAEGVLEIYEPRHRKPALTVVVGQPACRTSNWDDNSVRATVCAGLSFASEPSCWDDPAEREASESVGTSAAEAALGHRTLGAWLMADMGME